MKASTIASFLIVPTLSLLVGCSTQADFSDKDIAARLALASEFHPQGARLNRAQAIQLGGQAYEQQGFRPEDLGDPRASYIGTTRTFFGLPHKTWDVSFKNLSPNAPERYPTLSVYVDDRTGETEVVEKGARP